MKKRLKLLCLGLGMAFLSISSVNAALISGFDSINFDPAISHPNDYFGVYSSQTMPKGGWNAGFYLDWAKNPLEFGSPPGTRIAGVVDNQMVGNFYATYGILDWFSFGLDIPVVFYNDVRPWDGVPGAAAGFALDFDPQTNLGDIRLEFKFRIRDNSDETGRLIGVSLLPFVTLPTGPSSTFAGNGAVTGGLKAILDFNIHERVKLALNLGVLLRDSVQILNVDMDHQLLASLGLNVMILRDRLYFLAEGDYQPVISEIFGDEVENPLEVRGGFRVRINDRFNVNVGGGAGLTIGVGSPDWRAFLGLNYNWAPPPCDCVTPPPPVTRKIQIDQRIHFAFDKAVIKQQSYPILNDVASIIRQNMDSISSVSVEGNTDAVGSDAYNQNLSERRANAVKQYLMDQGIPADMLNTVGYGESRPIATNETAEGRALNRRVDFQVNNK